MGLAEANFVKDVVSAKTMVERRESCIVESEVLYGRIAEMGMELSRRYFFVLAPFLAFYMSL